MIILALLFIFYIHFLLPTYFLFYQFILQLFRAMFQHKDLLVIKLTSVNSRKKYNLSVYFDPFHEAGKTSSLQAPWSSHIRVDSSLVVPRSSFDLGILPDLSPLILSHFSCLLRSV